MRNIVTKYFFAGGSDRGVSRENLDLSEIGIWK